MSKEETSCHRKKLPATRRNFLSREETSSCHKKKLPVKGRNFLSQEETSCHRKKPPVTVRNLLSQEDTPPSCHMKKHLKIDIQMDDHNAEEEMGFTENVPLLQNALKNL
jgi:hypothetical protein